MARKQHKKRRRSTRRHRQRGIGGGIMKYFAPILVAAFILVAVLSSVVIVARWVDTQQPAWEVEAQGNAILNLKDRADELQNEIQRRAWFTEFWRVAFTGVLVAGAAGVAVYLWKVVDERGESKARMVDGSYALKTFRNEAGQQWTVDPNKSLFGAVGFDRASGQLVTDAKIVGADRQLTYGKAIQRTRTAQATPIDTIRNSAQAKFASGFYDRPQRPDEYQVVDADPAQLAVTPWHPLNLADAFALSTKKSWILGQSEQGDLCKFNVFSTIHTGLLGATNTGKTESTALLMAMYARNHGMHVIALDGAEGIDWQPYSTVFEVYETDHKLIGDQLDQIVTLYDRRIKANRLAGVETIYQLDYELPSLFIILEEFGKTMQGFKRRNPKQYELVEGALSELMRTSRKAGIFFLLMDQSMAGWSPELKPNVKDYIAYHLGGKQGAAFDAYKLHELREVGQFWNKDKVYEAWHTKAEAGALIQQLPARKVAMLTGPTIDSTIAEEGISEGKKEAGYTTPKDSAIAQNTPVDYSQNYSRDSSTIAGDSGTVASYSAPLTGKPTAKKEIELVRNTFALCNNNRRKTVEILYGKWNPGRDAWVKSIVNGEVLQ